MALQFRGAYVRDGVKCFATGRAGDPEEGTERSGERECPDEKVLLKIVAAIRDHIFDSSHERHLTFTMRWIYARSMHQMKTLFRSNSVSDKTNGLLSEFLARFSQVTIAHSLICLFIDIFLQIQIDNFCLSCYYNVYYVTKLL